MRVSVEIPEQKAGLDGALARQFADIQRQLMGWVKAKDEAGSAFHQSVLTMVARQQDALVSALERLIGAVQQSSRSAQPSESLIGAVQGLKRLVADLPGDLKGALDQQYQRVQHSMTRASPAPKVTVQMPTGLTTRIDRLEDALLQGLRRSRNRTFGSNY